MGITRVPRPPWPAKQPYSSKTIQVSGGNDVTLKQPMSLTLTAGGLNFPDIKIKEMVEDARTAISKVLTIQPVGLAYIDDLIKPVEALFNPERNRYFNRSEAWGTITLKLKQIQTGLTSVGHSIKVGTLNTPGVGHVNFYTDDTEGDIHLAKQLFDNNDGNATLTYLHEASHKYAKTIDYAYWKRVTGAWRSEEETPLGAYDRPKEKPITNVEALNNADSFAFLLYYLRPQTTWRR